MIGSTGNSATTTTPNLVEEPSSVTPTCSSFLIEELNEREHLSKLLLHTVVFVFLL